MEPFFITTPYKIRSIASHARQIRSFVFVFLAVSYGTTPPTSSIAFHAKWR
ncbi:hypothetical protein ARUE_c04070 [Arthrobacter sp. Rue61a]|nr:hypothetical protein ARUE_c04070 [Arthrobacter sp. Rue61a]